MPQVDIQRGTSWKQNLRVFVSAIPFIAVRDRFTHNNRNTAEGKLTYYNQETN